ncbi:glycosyltransferase 61 family protein [Pseudomonas atacamensis]|uniref:glycosyltransferase family 61 protein n=1 Tax=Pseudomonas atacamensis TaxID=2565368 RepID=UPI0021DA9800|nr:glycosyltransferase 61 family protein [Pseudomonas atacamensis]
MKSLLVKLLLVSHSYLLRLLAKSPASQEVNSVNNFDARLELVSPYFNVDYWTRCHPDSPTSANEAIVDFISRGFSTDSNPHPLFDGQYYLAQLPGVQWLDITLLEHYVLEGASAGLDPSPFFSTQYYYDSYPDIEQAGVNPLLHYIHSGVHEGRESLPIVESVLDGHFDEGLYSDFQNGFSLAYQAIVSASLRDYRKAIKLLRLAKGDISVSLYLKIAGMCFCLAGRFSSAQRVFHDLSQHPGILDSENLYSYVLMKAGAIAEGRGETNLAYGNFSVANQRGYELAGHALIKLARQYFFQGMTAQALRSISESNFKKGEFATHIMRMCSIKKHCSEFNYSYYEILPSRPIAEQNLHFLEEGLPLTSEAGGLLAPPFYIAVLESTAGISRCNVVTANGQIVLDGVTHPAFYRSGLGDLYDKENVVLSRNGEYALVQWPNKQPQKIEHGLKMFGVQSGNYGHWFLEFLPRMLAFDSDFCDESFTIVVDANMPQSHLDSLSLLNSKKRPVVVLPANTTVDFSKLAMTPVPAFFPLDVEEGVAYDTVWPCDIFSQLKTKIVEGLHREGFVFSEKPTRLFLSRRGFSSRQLLNEIELEKMLHDFGFTTIYPETMSFSEQVDAFQSATIVVGSCSSALTNAIFCNAGARIVALINDCQDFNFRGYASFIEAGGAHIMFVRGVSCPDQDSVHRYHRSYVVSSEAFSSAIHWALYE